MIYLEETFNLAHASWEALDNFIDFSQRYLVPICPDIGARLVAAWSSDEDWFCQVKQVLEFDDLNALKTFRMKTSQNKAWGDYAAGLEEHAPVRRSRLMEPLGSVPVEVLHQAIADSQETPNYGYVHAILEVGIDKMADFKAAVGEGYKEHPIIACWRPISGSPNEVLDIWKSPEPKKAYEPADEWGKEFFRGVRVMAPKERAVRLLALPYSPLH